MKNLLITDALYQATYIHSESPDGSIKRIHMIRYDTIR